MTPTRPSEMSGNRRPAKSTLPPEPAVLAGAEERDEHHPGERGRDEELPAEAHELVVAHSRQRPAQPHEEEHEDPQLGGEPQQAPPALVEHAVVDRRDPGRCRGATEEHRRREGGDGEHVDVLAEEEHREAHRAVLGVETTGELALTLGEVEGQPVGLTDHGDDVDEEAEERRDDEPEVGLGGDDLRRRHRARVEEDGHEREPHRDLVGDHLGRGAQPTHERVGRAGRPAGEHDAVDADTGHREHEQHGDRAVGQLEAGWCGRTSTPRRPAG